MINKTLKIFNWICVTVIFWQFLNCTFIGRDRSVLAIDNNSRIAPFNNPQMDEEPADRGSPDSNRSGAGRGDSCVTDPPLTALVPPLDTNDYVWGLTTQAYPKFWLYVPYSSNPSMNIEFQLRDESGKSVLNNKQAIEIALPETSGIINFRLPETQQSLVIDKWYQWSFVINCDSEEFWVRGWIKQVVFDGDLLSASPVVRLDNFVESGIWFDAITEVAEQLKSNPNDSIFFNAWSQLLADVKLEDISIQPFVSCCTINHSQLPNNTNAPQ